MAIILLILPSRLLAVSHENSENEAGRRGELILWVEALIFLFLVLIVVQNLQIILTFGTSIFGVPFIYLLAGIILLWLARFAIILYEFKVLNTHENTYNVLWHLIFYLGIGSFLIALNKIKNTAKGEKLQKFGKRDSLTIAILGITALALLLTAQPLDAWFSSWFDGSFADKFGLQHFIAFVFAGLVTSRLLWIRINMKEKYLGKIIISMVLPFIILIALMSLNHLWELLTENWGILNLSSTIIESTEQLFWVIAFIAFTYGIFRLKKTVKNAILVEEK